MKYIKNTPTVFILILYLLLFAGAYLLFSGRKSPATRFNALLDIWPDFYQHISNFTISYILLSGIGFMWLMLGVNFKVVTGLGIVVLLCNFIYELWIPILNTPDMIDAYYGFAGTVLAFVFLLIAREYGLRPNPLISERKQPD